MANFIDGETALVGQEMMTRLPTMYSDLVTRFTSYKSIELVDDVRIGDLIQYIWKLQMASGSHTG